MSAAAVFDPGVLLCLELLPCADDDDERLAAPRSLNRLHLKSSGDGEMLKSSVGVGAQIGGSCSVYGKAGHSATICVYAIVHSGTIVDISLRENLEWLSKATNWEKFSAAQEKFSATVRLGVSHRGYLLQGRSLMVLYCLQSGADSAVAGSGMRLLMFGTANEKAVAVYGREEEAGTLIEQMTMYQECILLIYWDYGRENNNWEILMYQLMVCSSSSYRLWDPGGVQFGYLHFILLGSNPNTTSYVLSGFSVDGMWSELLSIASAAIVVFSVECKARHRSNDDVSAVWSESCDVTWSAVVSVQSIFYVSQWEPAMQSSLELMVQWSGCSESVASWQDHILIKLHLLYIDILPYKIIHLYTAILLYKLQDVTDEPRSNLKEAGVVVKRAFADLNIEAAGGKGWTELMTTWEDEAIVRMQFSYAPLHQTDESYGKARYLADIHAAVIKWSELNFWILSVSLIFVHILLVLEVSEIISDLVKPFLHPTTTDDRQQQHEAEVQKSSQYCLLLRKSSLQRIPEDQQLVLVTHKVSSHQEFWVGAVDSGGFENKGTAMNPPGSTTAIGLNVCLMAAVMSELEAGKRCREAEKSSGATSQLERLGDKPCFNGGGMSGTLWATYMLGWTVGRMEMSVGWTWANEASVGGDTYGSQVPSLRYRTRSWRTHEPGGEQLTGGGDERRRVEASCGSRLA